MEDGVQQEHSQGLVFVKCEALEDGVTSDKAKNNQDWYDSKSEPSIYRENEMDAVKCENRDHPTGSEVERGEEITVTPCVSATLANVMMATPVHLKLGNIKSMKKRFSCSSCNLLFTKRKLLRIHECSHTVVELLPCGICGKSFPDNKNLNKHFRRVHFSDKTFTCEICSRSFAEKHNLGKHMFTHSSTPVECDQCGFYVKNLMTLQSHKKIHEDRQALNCSECTKTFLSKQVLRKHVEAIHLTPQQVACEECGKCFSKTNLRFHIKTHKKDPVGCNFCEKVFSNNQVLKKHCARTHSDRKELQFSCDQCGKTFSNKYTLSDHYRHVHAEKKIEPVHFCNLCGKSFKRKSCLTRHYIIHQSIKPHNCLICGKGFGQKHQLITHEKVHSGTREFACSFCDKSFHNKHNLVGHENIHRGIKPYHCFHCQLGFYRKDTLVNHMKVHSQ